MKNIASVLFVSLLLVGCGNMKGGPFPSQSFNEYREQNNRRHTTYEEVSSRTPDRSSLERRPNMGLNYSSGFGPGVEVDNFDSHRGSTTVITPRLWGKSKNYNRGVREEKWRDDQLRLRQEEDLARKLGQQDAYNGEMNFEGVPLKFLQTYEREFERSLHSIQRQDYHNRAWQERQDGRDDYRRKNPSYDRGRMIINDVERRAREDARRGIYNPPNDYKHYYDNVHKEETRRRQHY